jgi:hypothetical protein
LAMPSHLNLLANAPSTTNVCFNASMPKGKAKLYQHRGLPHAQVDAAVVEACNRVYTPITPHTPILTWFLNWRTFRLVTKPPNRRVSIKKNDTGRRMIQAKKNAGSAEKSQLVVRNDSSFRGR